MENEKRREKKLEDIKTTNDIVRENIFHSYYNHVALLRGLIK